jgi:general secretion pathway protein I
LSRSDTADGNSAGFTLIEVLVSLAIIAIALSSIGALLASAVRGTRSIDARLHRLHAARTIMTSLPDRNHLVSGIIEGETENNRWRIEMSPFPVSDAPPNSPLVWTPQALIATVQSPTGAAMQISTVRLRRMGK